MGVFLSDTWHDWFRLYFRYFPVVISLNDACDGSARERKIKLPNYRT